jgi:hypothetical protein
MKKLLYLLPILLTIILINSNNVFGFSSADFTNQQYFTYFRANDLVNGITFNMTNLKADMDNWTGTTINGITENFNSLSARYSRFIITVTPSSPTTIYIYFCNDNANITWSGTGFTLQNLSLISLQYNTSSRTFFYPGSSTVNYSTMNSTANNSGWIDLRYIYTNKPILINNSLFINNNSEPPAPETYLSVSGSYNVDFTNYDLSALIINSSVGDKIYYKLSGGSWQLYSNTLSITTNQLISFKLDDTSGKTLDYLEVNVTDIFVLDNSSTNFKINHLMTNFKSYITPVALGNFPYTVGVRIKVLSGLENIEEINHNEFIEKVVNEQFVLTGKANTNYTLLFQFYNINNSQVLKETTLTVYVKDGQGTVVPGDGSSYSGFDELNPNDPIGSITSFLTQSTSFFDFIKFVFSSLPVWITAPLSLFLIGIIVFALLKLIF